MKIDLQYLPAQKFMAETGKVIIGLDRQRLLTFVAMAASGHVLAEAMYGTGKTKFFESVQVVFKDAKYKRIQLTADLKPQDITGFSMRTASGERVVAHGAMHGQNFVLADEFTRGTEQAQGAFLQAMAEGTISIDGETFALENPFMIMASINPFAKGGTFDIDGAAADRFLFRLEWPYPSTADMKLIARGTVRRLERSGSEPVTNHSDDKAPQRVLCLQDVIAMRSLTRQIAGGASDAIIDYIVELNEATNPRKAQFAKVKLLTDRGDSLKKGTGFERWVEFGGSPRGVEGLLMASAALALFTGHKKIQPEHVAYLFGDAIRPHVRMADQSRWSNNRVTVDDFIAAVLAVVKPC